MKVYVASSFRLLEKVKDISDVLEKSGFEITVKWWDRIYEIDGEHIKTTDLRESYRTLTSEEFYNKHETRLSYFADYHGIKNADVFVFVASDIPRKYNGANIELGIALGEGIKCFSIGNLENSVLYYPVVKCKNKKDLLKRLYVYKKWYEGS